MADALLKKVVIFIIVTETPPNEGSKILRMAEQLVSQTLIPAHQLREATGHGPDTSPEQSGCASSPE